MRFNEEINGAVYCYGWCDIAVDDVLLGLIQKWPDDGFWRFTPLPEQPLTRRHLSCIAEKVSELNTKGQNQEINYG